jgi:hypothetical protein
MAEHVSQLPGFDTLFIISDQHGLFQAFLPENGTSLLSLVQLSAIWFGALMAMVALIGMKWQVQREGAR